MHACSAQPAKVIPKQALLALGKDNWLSRYRAGGRSAEEVDAIGRTQGGEDTPENRLRGEPICHIVFI